MTISLTTLLARHSKVGLTFAFVVFLSATPASGIRMARIAQLGVLGGNYPCGANHDGRLAVFGENYSGAPDSIVAYECEDGNIFRRIVTGGLTLDGVWAFGDGDGDNLMELVGLGHDGTAVVIYESRTDTSFPIDSVWGTYVLAPNFQHVKYVDFFRDGQQEIAIGVESHGIFLFENTGDNRYDLATVLNDPISPDGDPAGDFDVGDLDADSLMELVIGSAGHWLHVFKSAGHDHQWTVTRCSTENEMNVNIAVAHDMDHNGLPELIVLGQADVGMELMIYEAAVGGGYHRVWEQVRPDWYRDWFGNPISVGDIDGDKTEEWAVHTGGGVALFKCTGPHEYSEVWSRDSADTYERLFDINRDGHAELFFNGPHGTEIWEDTEGLGVAEFPKFSLESPVKVAPSVARLGASLLLSGISPGADIEVLSPDGRLVSRTFGVRQSVWTWDLRNQSGNLVPAGTYFAVIRSKGKSTSLKLCLVK